MTKVAPPCQACEASTAGEAYFLKDEVWAKRQGEPDAKLCVGCLEERLERKLTWKDFKPIPLNFYERLTQTQQLQDRLTLPLQVGSLVRARASTGVCSVGEKGVCYEVYELEKRPGYSILFEDGGLDGFSPLEVVMMLEPLDESVLSLEGYEFRSVSYVFADYRQGIFDEAFL